MPLIPCPECKKKISDRADFCPHCGLPAKYFKSFDEKAGAAKPAKPAAKPLPDISALKSVLISFDHSYQTYFSQGHYITGRELTALKASFEKWAKQLAKKTFYENIQKNALGFSIDMEAVDLCLRRFKTLAKDAENHNTKYVDRIVAQNKDL